MLSYKCTSLITIEIHRMLQTFPNHDLDLPFISMSNHTKHNIALWPYHINQQVNWIIQYGSWCKTNQVKATIFMQQIKQQTCNSFNNTSIASKFIQSCNISSCIFPIIMTSITTSQQAVATNSYAPCIAANPSINTSLQACAISLQQKLTGQSNIHTTTAKHVSIAKLPNQLTSNSNANQLNHYPNSSTIHHIKTPNILTARTIHYHNRRWLKIKPIT